MDNKGKRITFKSIEKTNSRQFIIVTTIIIPISVVHFPNELHQNSSQNPNWSEITNFQSFSHYLLKFSPTKPTTFSRLCQNLFCIPRLLCLSKLFRPSLISLRVTSIYTHPICSYLKQTNLNLLSKQCNLHLKLSHSVGGLCLLYKPTNIKLCIVIHLLPTIVQLSPYLK